MKIGEGYIEIRASDTKLKTDLAGSEKSVGDSTQKMQTSANSLTWKQAGVAVTSFAAVFALAMQKTVSMASDLEETASKFDVVFKGQEELAESWSKTLVDSYAMSTRESKLFLSSMQDLMVPMGMEAELAGQMSFEITKLSADLGSFNNLPTEQVMADLQSAMVGNYETMKKYGVVIKATTVIEKALAMGLAETKDELTAADKAQAAYAMIVAGSQAAVGDMERTQGSYANQTKQLRATVEDLATAYGTKLLPMATDFVEFLNVAVPTAYGNAMNIGVDFVDSSIRGSIHMQAAIETTFAGIEAAWGGSIDFMALEWATWTSDISSLLSLIPFTEHLTKPMEEYVVSLRSGISDGGKFAEITAEIAGEKEALLKEHEATIAAMKEENQQYINIEKSAGAATDANKALADAATETAGTDVKAKKAMAAAAAKYYKDMEWDSNNYYTYRIGLIDSEAKALDKAGMDSVQIAEWVTNEKKKLDKEQLAFVTASAKEKTKLEEDQAAAAKSAAEATADVWEDTYSSLGADAEGYHKFAEEQIKKTADEYREAGVDEVAVQAWVNAEKEKLINDQAEKTAETIQAEYELKQTLLEDMGKEDEAYFEFKQTLATSYFGDLKTKYKDNADMIKIIEAAELKAAEELQEDKLLATGTFFDGLVIGFGDAKGEATTWAEHGKSAAENFRDDANTAFAGFLNPLKDEFLNVDTLWDTMLESMLESLTTTVANMAIQWGLQAVGGITGYWESGLWEAEEDHLAYIHKGEMVVPADIAAVVRGGDGSSAVSDLSRISPSGGHEWDGETHQSMAAMAEGTAKSYALNAAQGISLAVQGYISPERLARGLISPELITGSFVAGGLPAGYASAFGIDPTAVTWGGNIGAIGLGVLAGVTGVAGAFVAGIGAVLGMTAAEGIMDALNKRADEEMKDFLEDQYGWFQGHIEYSNMMAAAPDWEGWDDPGLYDDSGDGGGGDRGFGGGRDPAGIGGTGSGVGDVGIAHEGGMIVKTGEGILSAEKGMPALDRLNRGDDFGGSVINVYIGNEQLDAYIDERADEIRVTAERRNMGTARII